MLTTGSDLWGRLLTCGGLLTRVRIPAVGRGLGALFGPGVQDNILPHAPLFLPFNQDGRRA